MLKIVTIDRPGDGAVLVLEGQVLGPWIGALEASCRAALAASDAEVRVDLAGVTFVAAEGAALLRRLPSDRVRLVNPSPLVAAQLQWGESR